jgi:hypothetical protein
MGLALHLCSNYFFTYVLIQKKCMHVLVGVKRKTILEDQSLEDKTCMFLKEKG